MSNTQFHGTTSETCNVVIGFDFGTSCSKVVLRTPYHYDSKTFAVPFDKGGHASCKYLIPSTLWLDGDGETASLTTISNGKFLRDIKLHLLEQQMLSPVNGNGENQSSCEFDPRIAATNFLAKCLSAARDWFLRTQKQLYGEFTLEWTLNLGLPSADFADEELCKSYEEMATAAWWLSINKPDATMSIAQSVLDSGISLQEMPNEDYAEIHLVPEVAAEVVGYARSKVRQNGLHMLVDIGASTLDICSFILHEDNGDDRYELLTADVQLLGASVLYRDRVEGVHNAVQKHLRELSDLYDPVVAMPDDLKAYAPSQLSVETSIRKSEDIHLVDCRKTIWKTILDLKTKRDPRSPVWQSQLPLFASGGGSAMPFYQRLFDNVSSSVKNFYTDTDGVKIISISKPTNFEAEIDSRTYHRFAVAWGLSYPETDIGNVTRPEEINDVEKRERYKHPREFISKDMV